MNIPFECDIRRLIPVDKRNKKFLMKTSFYTGSMEDKNIGCIAVSVTGFPTSGNKNYPETNLLRVGTATPKICQMDFGDNADFIYVYSESDCVPMVVDYPEIYRFDITLSTLSADDILANIAFDMTFSFEEI
jgi:hypothetical protein